MLVFTSFAIAAQACGTGSNDAITYPADDPTFVVTLGTPIAEVAAGTSVSTFIRTTRASGFTTSITYTAIAPTGLEVSVGSTSVADSSTLTIAASSALPEGRYVLVVKGTADGVAPQQAAMTVTVSVKRPPVIDLVFAGAHTCALTITGAAYCWGFNGHGELGNGDTAAVNSTPVAVAGGLKFQTLSVSKVDGVTCGLTADGVAYCWGDNSGGQLGDGTRTDRLTPTPVAGGLSFTSIAVGNSHACGVAMSGTAYCWGTTPNGAFGDGTVGTHLAPTATAAGLLLESIVAGSDYTCALTTDGAAYCWGLGVQGQLGNGEAVIRRTPVPVAGGLTFFGLAAGGMSTCGVTFGLETYCWGLNLTGTLGDGTFSRRLVPVPVSGGLTFQSISAGFETMCGVTEAGTGHCWGYNFGALGDGTSEHRSAPGTVSGGLEFHRIAAGTGYSCGVTTSGSVYCWGDNSNGQLGNGTTVASETPVPVQWP
jgi:alpha-tubulin suppressor-like RCC1 family protein